MKKLVEHRRVISKVLTFNFMTTHKRAASIQVSQDWVGRRVLQHLEGSSDLMAEAIYYRNYYINFIRNVNAPANRVEINPRNQLLNNAIKEIYSRLKRKTTIRFHCTIWQKIWLMYLLYTCYTNYQKQTRGKI